MASKFYNNSKPGIPTQNSKIVAPIATCRLPQYSDIDFL